MPALCPGEGPVVSYSLSLSSSRVSSRGSAVISAHSLALWTQPSPDSFYLSLNTTVMHISYFLFSACSLPGLRVSWNLPPQSFHDKDFICWGHSTTILFKYLKIGLSKDPTWDAHMPCPNAWVWVIPLLPSCASEGAANDGSNTWFSVTHMGDLVWDPGFWLQPSPFLAFACIWWMN